MDQNDVEKLVTEQGWDADQTYLYFIAEQADFLDRVAADLRPRNPYLADAIDKLQQDAGVEIVGINPEPPGPQTAALQSAYESVTPARLKILSVARDRVFDPELEAGLADLVKMLPSVDAAVPPAPKSPQP